MLLVRESVLLLSVGLSWVQQRGARPQSLLSAGPGLSLLRLEGLTLSNWSVSDIIQNENVVGTVIVAICN